MLRVPSPSSSPSPPYHRARRSIPPSLPRLALIAGILASIARPGASSAQDQVQYQEQPTRGIDLPGVGLAGEHDAFSVSVNPAGLRFLRALHAGLALDIMDAERATSAGQGLGLYLGHRIGGGLLPTMGLGLGLEFGRPSRTALTPDPGTPARLSLAYALPLGKHGGLGLSYHRFFDEPGAPGHGLSSWDLGLAFRLGAHFAAGGVIRNLNTPEAGGADVPRSYELELTTRPQGTERWQLALGGRVGEVREDRAELDGWARLDARVARGLFVHGQVETRALTQITTSPLGPSESREREYRASLGLTVSLGAIGTSFWGTGARGPDRANRLSGGTLLVRASSERVPSILGPGQRIERLEISGSMDQRQLTSLVLYLRALARDDGVVALLVTIDDLDAGWATAQELWDELGRVRRAGKRVYAYLVDASTRDYFLATAADRIYLDPAGGIRLQGFAASSVYFKGVFDQLGVTAQFIKIDEYKSAPEAYTRDSPTEPALRMREALYDDVYEHLAGRIAERRGMDRSEVLRLIDSGPYSAGDLASSPLVDAVALPDEISALVITDLGRAYRVASARLERPERWSLPAIAVIYIEGDIVGGESRTVPLLGRKIAGGKTIAQAIARARADQDIEAIVLRIDSPGGSALASEIMAREVFATRGVKPIICSMGDVAASGGYFVAAGCDVILAEPTTVTGSIGIFTGKFDLSGLLARVGLSWTVYKRGARADMDSYFRPYSAEEEALILDKIRYLYGRFTGVVAQGRSMTVDQVDAIARGRVWSGRAARAVNLVDRFGGLADAIDLAKERAGLGKDRRVRVIKLPGQRTGLLERALGVGRARDQAASPASAASALFPGGRILLEAIPASLWQEPGEIQARLPFTLVWH